MGTKLYQRQGGQLQGMDVINPPKADTQSGEMLRGLSSEFHKIAEDNFALGQKHVLMEVIDNAYKVSPNNLQKFNELVNQGMNKAGEVLTPELAKRLNNDMFPKIALYQSKVQNNVISLQDKERSQNIISLSERYAGDLGTANDLYIQAAKNSDRQGMDRALALINNTQLNLKQLAGAKNINGSYVIGDKATRDMILTGQYGKIDSIKRMTSDLTADELKDFDKNTLQSPQFKKEFGLTDDTVETMGKYIKARGKELDVKFKREITLKNQFNAAAMIVGFKSKDEIEGLRGKTGISDEFVDTLERTYNKKKDVINPAYADKAFIKSIYDVANMPSNTDNVELLNNGAKLLENVMGLMQESGTSEEKQQLVTKSINRALTDEVFGQTLNKMFKNDTALGFLFSQINYDVEENKMMRSIESVATGGVKPILEREVNFDKETEEKRENNKEVKREIAEYRRKNPYISSEQQKLKENKALEATAILTSMLIMGESEDKVRDTYDLLNKEIIKIDNMNRISDFELMTLEQKRKNNEPAIHYINGIPYQYRGFSKDSILFEPIK